MLGKVFLGAIIVIHMEAFKITETDLGAAQDTIADQIVEKKRRQDHRKYEKIIHEETVFLTPSLDLEKRYPH